MTSARMRSFDQKPALSSGKPASARQPTNINQQVTGMRCRRPDIVRMSSFPARACITEPAVRNSRALKKAWV